MARTDELLTQIPNKVLRSKIEGALADIKRRQSFGLVFEEHVPETTTLRDFPITVGSTVQRRRDVARGSLYSVQAMDSDGGVAVLPESGGNAEWVSADELIIVKRFGDRSIRPLHRLVL